MSSSVTSAALQLNNHGSMGEFLFGNESSLFTYQNTLITSFSKNIVPIIFTETVDFSNTLTLTLPYSGDLIGNLTFHVLLPALTIPQGSTFVTWTNAIGFAMINYVEIYAGDIKVVHIERDLLEILDYFSTDASKAEAQGFAIGRYDNVSVLQNPTFSPSADPLELYVNFPFWFCRALSSCLPITCIPNQPIKFKINLNPFSQVVNYDGNIPPTPVSMTDARLIADYYLLSAAEKTDFQTNDHQYIFEQYQTQVTPINALTATGNYPIKFLNSVKELIITFRETASEDNNDFFNYGLRDPNRQGREFVSTIQLFFNGVARTEKLDEKYFRVVTPLQSHVFAGERNVYVIPFAANPESNQSSGSANFSQLSSVSVSFDFVNNLPACNMQIFAISYNILDIHNGVTNVTYF